MYPMELLKTDGAYVASCHLQYIYVDNFYKLLAQCVTDELYSGITFSY